MGAIARGAFDQQQRVHITIHESGEADGRVTFIPLRPGAIYLQLFASHNMLEAKLGRVHNSNRIAYCLVYFWTFVPAKICWRTIDPSDFFRSHLFMEWPTPRTCNYLPEEE